MVHKQGYRRTRASVWCFIFVFIRSCSTSNYRRRILASQNLLKSDEERIQGDTRINEDIERWLTELGSQLVILRDVRRRVLPNTPLSQTEEASPLELEPLFLASDYEKKEDRERLGLTSMVEVELRMRLPYAYQEVLQLLLQCDLKPIIDARLQREGTSKAIRTRYMSQLDAVSWRQKLYMAGYSAHRRAAEALGFTSTSPGGQLPPLSKKDLKTKATYSPREAGDTSRPDGDVWKFGARQIPLSKRKRDTDDSNEEEPGDNADFTTLPNPATSMKLKKTGSYWSFAIALY